ncbi:bifunctional 2-polyprenyl-6-hydroxyphenol methylase/3-demethylubiquinol 3-O-methyltransferase UbiG [Thalassospira xiamenensis]|uniref:class I SAM-dependent methyltransferase n=1 Tax=Thalassospira xiamenensis TaxID=220697 RepID=UPI000DEDD0BF|nr:methyltransferase domain-containing protein [Thalassospira xiamenensis]
MASNIIQDDKAGQEYWNNTWDDYSLPPVWDVDSSKITKHVEREFFLWIKETLEHFGKTGSNVELVEVGCARSQVLPILASQLGVSISGIDYSPNGCEQARMMLDREDIKGNIFCHDIFSIPKDLKRKFDVVISFGLIEHFSDTKEIVQSLSELLKPGGIILTSLPNMNGTVGFFQKTLNRSIYDIHVPLTPDQVRVAHEASGLDVIETKYFLSTNFGIVNLGSPNKTNPTWWAKKITLAVLTRLSMAAWWAERKNIKLSARGSFSPYINCVARKP